MTTSKTERRYEIEELTPSGKPYKQRRFIQAHDTRSDADEFLAEWLALEGCARRYRIVTFVEEEKE